MSSRFMASVILLLGIGFSGVGLAQEPIELTLGEYDQRITELESSVAQLRECRPQAHACPVTYDSFYAGYSFGFTRLHYKESFQALVSDLGTGTLNLVPFEHDYELTPRVWFGYRSASGLGLRGSYWNFDHASSDINLVNDGVRIPSATATSVIFPALIVAPFPGDQLSVGSSLEATTLDLEATYDFRVQRLEAVVGVGIRYAHFDQRFDAVVTPGLVPGAAPAALNWLREFEGLGPLFTAQGKLPIGGAGFYGTGGLNLSFLFGDKTLIRTVLNDATPAPNAGLPILRFDDSQEITGIYGASIGLGWRRDSQFGQYFVEGAYESQLWTDGGAPTITFAGFNGFSLTLGLAI